MKSVRRLITEGSTLFFFFCPESDSYFYCTGVDTGFVYFVPVPVPDKGEKHLKGRDSLALIVFMGVSVWLALAAVVMSVIPYTLHFVRYLMVFSPVVLITGMFIATAWLLYVKQGYMCSPD